MTFMLRRCYTLFVRSTLRALERAIYEPRLKRAYLELSRAYPTFRFDFGRILDVGANDGTSIKFFNRLFAELGVVAFEPVPSVAARLRHRTGKMKIDIAVVEIAASDTDAKKTLARSFFDEVSTLEPIVFDSSHLRNKARVLLTSPESLYVPLVVKCLRIDTWLSSAPHETFDIVKIDTEGHELAVLNGAGSELAARFRVVQIESHRDDHYDISRDAISQLLLDSGFQLFKAVRHSFGDFVDEIWVHKDV